MIYTAHIPQLPPALANPFDIDVHTHYSHHYARLAHDAKTKERRTYFGHTHGVALTIHDISVGHVGFLSELAPTRYHFFPSSSLILSRPCFRFTVCPSPLVRFSSTAI